MSSVRAINHRAAVILPLAAVVLASVMSLLAELPRIDWDIYMGRAPLTIPTPSVPVLVALAVVTAAVSVAAVATNRRSRRV